jgi:hypothetical protein
VSGTQICSGRTPCARSRARCCATRRLTVWAVPESYMTREGVERRAVRAGLVLLRTRGCGGERRVPRVRDSVTP